MDNYEIFCMVLGFRCRCCWKVLKMIKMGKTSNILLLFIDLIPLRFLLHWQSGEYHEVRSTTKLLPWHVHSDWNFLVSCREENHRTFLILLSASLTHLLYRFTFTCTPLLQKASFGEFQSSHILTIRNWSTRSMRIRFTVMVIVLRWAFPVKNPVVAALVREMTCHFWSPRLHPRWNLIFQSRNPFTPELRHSLDFPR